MKTARCPGIPRKAPFHGWLAVRPLAATIAALLMGMSAQGQVIFGNAPGADPDRENVFVAPDRELRQLIEGAKEAIAQERFGDAVEALNELLVDPQMEDYFLGNPNDATQLSLKAEAHRLLSSLPPAGRLAYEQKFGNEARRLLDEAIQQAHPERLAQIARLYFHTHAGMEAAMLLGRYHLNRGRPLAGALWLKRLMEVSEQAAVHGRAAMPYSPTARYDPELSVLLAECWLEAGIDDSARQTLLDLKRRLPTAQVRVGDSQVALFAQEDAALAWLEGVLGARRAAGSLRESDWTLFRGNPARNAETAGGFPLPQYVWRAPISNDPSDVETIAQIEKSEFRSARVPALPAGQPLAVGDTIVMRTPTQVVGVDFQEGKRTWLFPPPNSIFDRSLETEDALPSQMAEVEKRKELKQRIWEDAPYGQLSSDGEAVFFVHDLGYALEGMRQTLIARGGLGIPNPKFPKSYNQLVALDLRGEGKLRWIVGGESGENEPRLAGAFFLGPPLPLAGQLYVLAEINAEIRLVTLDGKTGQLQWAQQLAHVDPSDATILEDIHRRLTGATPSFADGVLVCPTSAGAVVAVDLAARSLLWGYRYQRNAVGPTLGSPFGTTTAAMRELGNRWADGAAVIADGRVLVTPVESDYLHCLDLLTGRMVWQQPRGEALFVAGVHQGRTVVVGKTHVAAYDLATGKLAWEQEVGLPTGRGFLSGGDYYQPVYHVVTDGEGEQSARFELVQLNLATAEVVARVETEKPLGNLICHRDQIVSQSAQGVGALYQVEPLRKIVAARLAKDDNDAWAVARQAQLLRHDGDDEAALVALRRAHELNAEDEYTRQLLIDTMLKFLALDFPAHRAFVEEVQRLDPTADQRSEFLRLLIVGYQKTGELEAAFQACLKLAGLDGFEGVGAARAAMDQVGAQLTVRRDRWIRARIKELLAAADAGQRAAIDEAIAARWQATLAAEAPSALSRFINHFGAHPLADRARLRLAEKVLATPASLLEAELLLVSLEDAADPAIAAPANFHLAKIMERAQRWREAARYYRRLEERWPDAELDGGLTAAQLVAKLPPDSPVAQALRGPAVWPPGRVETKTTEERLANVSAYQRVYPIELTQARGALERGYRLAFDQQQLQLTVSDEAGRPRATIFVNNAPQSMRVLTQNREYRNSAYHERSVYHAKANGHLLLASFGAQLMAFNLLDETQPAGESLLWREDVDPVQGADPSRAVRGVTQLTQYTPWGDPFVQAVGANQKAIGLFGPLNEHGVCLQRRNELACVHPLTGETLWVRENVEAGSDLFGDDDYLFVIPPSGPQAKQAMVLNALDGTLVGYRDVPVRTYRWTTLGRRLLHYRNEGKAMVVCLSDLLEPSPHDWERPFPKESKGCLVERDKLAVLEPTGKFTLLALADGKVLIEAHWEPDKSLQSIYVLPSPDQYLVFANSTYRESDATSIQPPAIPDAPLVNGRVYALDRTTGRALWPSPAYLEQWGVPLDQPTGTPVVLLMRRETQMAAGSSRRNTLALLCLDRRDGTLIYQKRELAPNASIGNDRYTLKVGAAPNTVDLVLAALGVTFAFTEEPHPPQPPLETGMLSALEAPLPGVAITEPYRAARPPRAADALPPPPIQLAPAGGALPPGLRLNVGGQLVPLLPPAPPNAGNAPQR